MEYRDVSGISNQRVEEEELDRVLDILAENQVQILDGEKSQMILKQSQKRNWQKRWFRQKEGHGIRQTRCVCILKENWKDISSDSGRGAGSGHTDTGREPRGKGKAGKG